MSRYRLSGSFVLALVCGAGRMVAADASSTNEATEVVTLVMPPQIQILEIVAPPARSGVNSEKTAQNREVQRRLAEERTKQQQLVKLKAEEAKARVDYGGKDPDRSVVFGRLIDNAERYVAEEKFQLARLTLADAMKIKPADLRASERVRTLASRLKALSTPVEVTLKSDGETFVSIPSLLPPQKLYSARLKLLPGDYEVNGARRDHPNVTIKLRVRDGEPPPAAVSVVCN